MLKNWRSWVLLFLFIAPYLVFMGLGFLWLKEHGWAWIAAAGALSIVSGAAMALLMARWTKTTNSFLPPLDWEAPATFSDFDRQAWVLVEGESELGENHEMAQLYQFQTYIDTGQRLANRLAAHYNPLSADPLERVAVVELLTALELAAEDLTGLCRQVPGGDLVTPADWKKAVVAANYIQKASDLYTYLLPLFNPVTGLPRLASQHLMVKPAWKNMQQNLLRWFFRAFVNRLGMHLIELYSGRLVIGADQYRKLTRKFKSVAEVDASAFELTIAVAGARDSGKSTLIEALKAARIGNLPALKGKLASLGGDEVGFDRLAAAKIVEIDSYTPNEPGKESARNRSTRRHAVAEAVEADLMILVVHALAGSHEADASFLKDWAKWYVDHPGLEVPPILAVMTHVDSPQIAATDWKPPIDWINGNGPRESAVRSRIQALRRDLPPNVAVIIPVAVGAMPPSGVIESLLPALTGFCHRAERNALIRHLRNASARSRAGRLVRQVGQQGKSLWKSLKDRRKTEGGDAA